MDLTVRVRAIVRAFRLGEDAQANDWLVGLIDTLAVTLARPPLAQRAPRIMATLEEVLNAQLRVDTLGIADLLQYRLLPLLDRA
jgi:hypothetical protein